MPLPSPRSRFTFTVKVCLAPTSFVPLPVMAIFASTYVFTASNEFGALPSVVAENDPPPNEVKTVAWPVTCPVFGDEKTTLQVPVALRLFGDDAGGVGMAAVSQVDDESTTTSPFEIPF